VPYPERRGIREDFRPWCHASRGSDGEERFGSGVWLPYGELMFLR